VAALAEQGAFSAPPPPERDEAGYVRDAPWPEIDYLVRMASLVPEDVVNITDGFIASENAWVRRGVVELASRVPADQAARLARVIAHWAPDELGVRTDPRDLAVIAENLLRGGQTKLGVVLANALYHPREATQTGRFRSEPRVAMESYWFEQSLPRIADAFGEDRLVRILPWLEDFQIHAGSVKANSDLSYFGRPYIASRPNHAGDIEHALIDAVRDAAVERFARKPADTVARLLRSGQALSKKIALFAAASALHRANQDGSDVAPLLAAVSEFPAVVEFTRSEYLPEFTEFLTALSKTAGSDSLAGLSDLLPHGPLGSRPELIECLRAGQMPEDLEAEADDYIAGWQQRLLSAVGADSLPQGLRELLEKLNQERGEIENAGEPEYGMTSWAGPISPADHEAFSSMGGEALLQHLEGWHPDSTERRGASHEGQGRELTTFIAGRPDALPPDSARLLGLRPTYLRAVIRGWADARKDNHALPWAVVVPVLVGISQLDDASNFAHEGRDSFDDDTDYKGSKTAVLSLIESILSKREGIPEAPSEIVEAVAPVLITMSGDPAFRVEYESTPSDSFDPLTLSLNRRLPIAVRALTQLAAWEGFGGEDGAAVVALSDHLPTDDGRGAIAAVFGEALARLYNSARPWLEKHTGEIFGGEGVQTIQQQIALSTALATQRSHSLLLNHLRAPITSALTRETPLAVGWSSMRTPEQLLGDWVVTTYNTGGIDRDDPLLDLFFAHATPYIRGDVLGHVGWSLMHATEVDEAVRQRIEGLWDARVEHVRERPEDEAELKDFYWYVRSEKFEANWWLPRLLEASTLVRELNTHGMIGEQLADASKADPATAFEVIRGLTVRADDADDQFGGYDLLERAVPQTLASALDSSDAGLITAAVHLMDTLGSRGYIDLDSRVQALRKNRQQGLGG